MKKSMKISMMAALSISALTPVASIAAEQDQLPAGFYDVKTGEVISADSLLFASNEEKLAILTNPNFYYVNEEGNVIKATSILTAKTDAEVNDAIQTVEEVEKELDVEFTAGGVIINPDPEEPTPPGGGGTPVLTGNQVFDNTVTSILDEIRSETNNPVNEWLNIDFNKTSKQFTVGITDPNKTLSDLNSIEQRIFNKLEGNLKVNYVEVTYKGSTIKRTPNAGESYITYASLADLKEKAFAAAGVTEQTNLQSFNGKKFTIVIGGVIGDKTINNTEYTLDFNIQ
ncbi:hypothetical protein CSV69_10160 [Sporosarcina sp. P26b]|nr:hypothetical protein CSV69_10160 [Sporosarcina sp. P26b]